MVTSYTPNNNYYGTGTTAGYIGTNTSGGTNYDSYIQEDWDFGTANFKFVKSNSFYDDGDKPLHEFDNKCDGILKIWELSKLNKTEYSAVITIDGAVLITQKLKANGGGISGIYEYNGITYYQYPSSQGLPNRTYSGQLTSTGRYFILIRATIHSHTPCIKDGTDGLSENLIKDDQNFAKQYTLVKHYIIGCSSVGEFNGSSDTVYNIKNDKLINLCSNIK